MKCESSYPHIHISIVITLLMFTQESPSITPKMTDSSHVYEWHTEYKLIRLYHD